MFIQTIQIISAILLVILILMQNKGTGLGAAFGGSDNVTRTKRGAEKGMFVLTIIISIIFLGSALANFLI